MAPLSLVQIAAKTVATSYVPYMLSKIVPKIELTIQNRREYGVYKNKTIYKSKKEKDTILKTYDRILEKIGQNFEEKMIDTRFGKTHILVTGPKDAIPLMIFQGGNTVNPVTLSWFQPLLEKYRVYAPDTIGHPGYSSENRISSNDNNFSLWVTDILDILQIDKIFMIGPSYGAGIILRTATYAPERILKAVLLMPSGIVSGSIWKMIYKIVLPMLFYRILPNKKMLNRAITPLLTLTEESDELNAEIIGLIYRYIKLEIQLPKYTTKEELKKFDAPVMLFAGENDIFFPAEKVIKKSKEIIPNLISAEKLYNCKHFPTSNTLDYINKKIDLFLKECE